MASAKIDLTNLAIQAWVLLAMALVPDSCSAGEFSTSRPDFDLWFITFTSLSLWWYGLEMLQWSHILKGALVVAESACTFPMVTAVVCGPFTRRWLQLKVCFLVLYLWHSNHWILSIQVIHANMNSIRYRKPMKSKVWYYQFLGASYSSDSVTQRNFSYVPNLLFSG